MGWSRPDDKKRLMKSSFGTFYMQTRLLQSVYRTAKYQYQCTDLLPYVLSSGAFAKKWWYEQPIHHLLLLQDNILTPPEFMDAS